MSFPEQGETPGLSESVRLARNQRPYVLIPPPVWFHDIYHTDRVRYRQHEEQRIREFTTSANKPGPPK